MYICIYRHTHSPTSRSLFLRASLPNLWFASARSAKQGPLRYPEEGPSSGQHVVIPESLELQSASMHSGATVNVMDSRAILRMDIGFM